MRRAVRGLVMLVAAGAMMLPDASGWGGGALSAQELVPGEGGADALVHGGGGAVFQSFRFGDGDAVGIESLSLLTIPIAVGTPRSGRFGIELHGGWARGSMSRPDGSSSTVDGLIDTSLRVRADLVPDRVSLTGSVVLPTGAESHTADQLEVAGAVASDLLPFRISHWSSGGGAGLALAAFHSFGRTGIGFDAGFQRAGEFEPTADADAAYRPGHSTHLAVALDRAIGPDAKVTVRADARRYGDDELDGQNLFRSGNRFGTTAAYSFASGAASSGVIYAGYRHRSSGTFLVDLERRPSQGVLLAGAGFRTPYRGGIVTPSADVRVLRRSDGTGQGYTASVGAGGEWDTAGVTLLPGARLRAGSVLVQEGLSSGFVGLDISLQLRRGGGS